MRRDNEWELLNQKLRGQSLLLRSHWYLSTQNNARDVSHKILKVFMTQKKKKRTNISWKGIYDCF